MSEFSNSYHLRDAPLDDVVAFVRRRKERAIVLPEGERWTCVVAAELGPWDGVHVQFSHAPDHECSVRLFEGRRKIGVIRILFEGQKPHAFDPEPWLRLGLLDDAGAAQIARWVERGDPGPQARRVGYRLAELLGFRHFKWLSERDLVDRWDEVLSRDPGAVGVDSRAKARPVAAAPAPGPTLVELLVQERFVTLLPGRDPVDLEAGVQAILVEHPGAAARTRELLRWLRAQKSVRRVDVDESVLEGILEAW